MNKEKALQVIRGEIVKTFDEPKMKNAANYFKVIPQKLSNDLSGRPDIIPDYLLNFAGIRLKEIEHNYVRSKS